MLSLSRAHCRWLASVRRSGIRALWSTPIGELQPETLASPGTMESPAYGRVLREFLSRDFPNFRDDFGDFFNLEFDPFRRAGKTLGNTRRVQNSKTKFPSDQRLILASLGIDE